VGRRTSPAGFSEETVERCRRLGIALPQRYLAQPDVTDTPAEQAPPKTAPAPPRNYVFGRNRTMSASTAQSELRLSSLVDEREKVTQLHEQLLARVQGNDDKMPDEVQAEQIKGTGSAASSRQGDRRPLDCRRG
jgi:hypothetical protein